MHYSLSQGKNLKATIRRDDDGSHRRHHRRNDGHCGDRDDGHNNHHHNTYRRSTRHRDTPSCPLPLRPELQEHKKIRLKKIRILISYTIYQK